MVKQTTAANLPFVWATGMNVTRVAPADGNSIVDQYRVNTGTYEYGPIGSRPDLWHKPESEIEVWESGWPFPIP